MRKNNDFDISKENLVKVWDGFHAGPDLDLILQSLDKNMGEDIEDLLYIHTHAPFIAKETKLLPSGSKILEAGFGLGHWVFWFAKQGHLATGIDISPKAIQIATTYAQKHHLKNVSFLEGDVRDTPFESNFFDYIFSFGVIEHFNRPKAVLEEFRRILKPGGKIFLSVPNFYSLHTLKRPLLKKLGLWRVGGERSFTQNELKKIVKSADLKFKESGVMPSEEFFGRFAERTPFFGKVITKFLRRLSYILEKSQNIFGFWIYIIAQK